MLEPKVTRQYLYSTDMLCEFQKKNNYPQLPSEYRKWVKEWLMGKAFYNVRII